MSVTKSQDTNKRFEDDKEPSPPILIVLLVARQEEPTLSQNCLLLCCILTCLAGTHGDEMPKTVMKVNA
jgi:hypothetical protein